jgi:hypothetical protein
MIGGKTHVLFYGDTAGPAIDHRLKDTLIRGGSVDFNGIIAATT